MSLNSTIDNLSGSKDSLPPYEDCYTSSTTEREISAEKESLGITAIKATPLTAKKTRNAVKLARLISSQFSIPISEAEPLCEEILRANQWMRQQNLKELKLKRADTGLSHTFVIKGALVMIHTKSRKAKGGFKVVQTAAMINLTTNTAHEIIHKKIRPNNFFVEDPCTIAKEEAQKQTDLLHPSVPQVYLTYEYSTAKGSRLSIYEYKCETTGEDLILRKKFRSFSQKVQFFYQLSSCLNYIHKNGNVHNDLKLDNTMIADSFAMLIDYGLMTRNGEIPPTAFTCTLPPERKSSSKTTPATFASDVFQFGLILAQAFVPGAQMTIGSKDASSYQSTILTALSNWSPTTLNEISLKDLILECLSEDPTKRPRMITIKHALRKLTRKWSSFLFDSPPPSRSYAQTKEFKVSSMIELDTSPFLVSPEERDSLARTQVFESIYV